MTLGLLEDTKTLHNLRSCPDCVVNLPSPDMWRQVETLAPLTGRNPVPEDKKEKFRFARDKFRAGSFTRMPSETVSAPRVRECLAQMEAVVRKIHALEGDRCFEKLGGGAAAEVEIVRVHFRPDFILKDNYIDPGKWQPLVTTFATISHSRRNWDRLSAPKSKRGRGTQAAENELVTRPCSVLTCAVASNPPHNKATHTTVIPSHALKGFRL